MANIKVFNLNSTDSNNLVNEFTEEFTGTVFSAVNRSLASHELQDIRGGADFDSTTMGMIGMGYGAEAIDA